MFLRLVRRFVLGVFGLLAIAVASRILFRRDNDTEAVNLAGFGIDNSEMQVLVFEAITLGGDISQLGKGEAAHGFVGLIFGNVQTEFFVDLVHVVTGVYLESVFVNFFDGLLSHFK